MQQRQCVRQWLGFLSALSAEFAEVLPETQLQELMARIGTRFALANALPSSDTAAGLQDAMNQLWRGLDWGYVQLEQSADGLEITHHYSPLAAAFGQGHMEWATGFLQGAYQQWFEMAGAAGLEVRITQSGDAWGSAGFLLSPAA